MSSSSAQQLAGEYPPSSPTTLLSHCNHLVAVCRDFSLVERARVVKLCYGGSQAVGALHVEVKTLLPLEDEGKEVRGR